MQQPPDIASSPAHGFVVVNGLRHHYLDFGGDGNPLLLLHGVTSHGSIWRATAPLVRGRRSIALDFRGHGDSQWSADGAYSTEDLASDVLDFIEVMDLGPVDIVGGSWGGLVGLNAAVRNQDVAKSLTMIDVPPSFPGPVSEISIDPQSYPTHAESVAYIHDANGFIDRETAETVAAHGVRPGKNGQLYAKHDDYFHEARPHRGVDYWKDLESLRLPLLIVRARNSLLLSESVADRMLHVAHDGELAVIPRTGHRIPTDNPAALAEVLRRFLAR
ncbi:MAG: alpha/beta fold hydrolase [Pirellulales bacterium]